MPRGPKGEKRPADAIGNAVMIASIATGEIEDITTEDGKRREDSARTERKRPQLKGGQAEAVFCIMPGRPGMIPGTSQFENGSPHSGLF
jgi:hypothetical protein